MASLGVVADGVVSTETDPLGDGLVLVGLLGKPLLDLEALVRRLKTNEERSVSQ